MENLRINGKKIPFHITGVIRYGVSVGNMEFLQSLLKEFSNEIP